MNQQKRPVRGAGHPEKVEPPVSYPMCLALVSLVLLPAVIIYVAALAAGVPPFRDFRSWFTLCGSISIATVLCIFRPGGVGDLLIFCINIPIISGVLGGLVWAVFPVSAYVTTLVTSFLAFVVMAYPLILEFIRADSGVIRRDPRCHK